MLSFFNSNHFDKFVICGSSEVSLYELKEKNHEPDFIYDYPKLQNISKLIVFLSFSSFTFFVYIFPAFFRQLEVR